MSSRARAGTRASAAVSLPVVRNPRRVIGHAVAVLAILWPATSAGAGGHSAANLDTNDAVLAIPAHGVTRTLGPDQGCQVLLDRGRGDCAVMQTANGQLIKHRSLVRPSD